MEAVALEKNGVVPFNLADFYKTGHPGMYPEGMSKLVANFTPRSSKHAPVLRELFDEKVVWYGLTGFMQEFLVDLFNREFFNAPDKEAAIRKYRRRMNNALGKGSVNTAKVAALHDLGYLPLEIRALPEGCRVNIKVPPVIFISTHDDFAWVVTYIETLFSCEMWKPATVATIAFEFRKLATYFAKLTGAPLDFIYWQIHDFSMRGMSGVHDAARCGSGVLLSFFGTDTIPAIDYHEDFYGADSDRELIGGSIPATEHSVMTLRILLVMKRLAMGQIHGDLSTSYVSKLTGEERDAMIKTLQAELDQIAMGGEVDERTMTAEQAAAIAKRARDLRKLAEKEVIRQLIEEDFPEGMLSIVADSFDYWATITEVAPALADKIKARRPNELGMAKIVFRPDSGDPVKILTGYFDDELVCDASDKPIVFPDGLYRALHDGVKVTEHERKGSVQCLYESFGGTETDKGFKVLHERVGLIYGDSISLVRALQIFLRLARKGFASCNVVFGVGSYTYNMLSRDTFGWAMKALYAEVEAMYGKDRIEIYKDPATDDGTKKSAKGLVRVEKEGDDYVLYDQQTLEQFEQGEYKTVFRNSVITVRPTLAGMRGNLMDSWTCPDPETNPIEWRQAA
jgi:nicotinamide phosphoribosyltransferase